MENQFPKDNLTQVSQTLPATRDPLYIVLPVTVIYSVILLGGLVGNVVTCAVIVRNKYMHTATNYYLFSLAVSDLVLLVTGLPQEMVSIWMRYPYIFGEAFCVIRGLATETSTNATVLTIAAFTAERYIAICHPLRSHTMSKLSRAIKLILAIWTLAILLAVPQALQLGIVTHRFLHLQTTVCSLKRILIQHAFEISTFVFFVAPMTLITVLYMLIGLKLRRSRLSPRDVHSGGGGSKRKSHKSNQQPCVPVSSPYGSSSRRVVRMLVAVVVAFFVCWAPFHAQRLLAIYGDGGKSGPSPTMQKIYDVLTYVSGILYYVSTSINPILYNILSRKFRQAFKATLSSCCGWSKSASRRDNSEPSRVPRQPTQVSLYGQNNYSKDRSPEAVAVEEDPGTPAASSKGNSRKKTRSRPSFQQNANDSREKRRKLLQKIRVLYQKPVNQEGMDSLRWKNSGYGPRDNGRLELCTFVAEDHELGLVLQSGIVNETGEFRRV